MWLQNYFSFHFFDIEVLVTSINLSFSDNTVHHISEVFFLPLSAVTSCCCSQQHRAQQICLFLCVCLLCSSSFFFFLPLLRVHLWPVRVIQNVRAAKIIRGKQCNIPPEWWMKGDEKIALRFIKNDICIMSFGLRWWDVTRIYVFPTSPKGRHFWAVWFCVVKGHISVTIKLFWSGLGAILRIWARPQWKIHSEQLGCAFFFQLLRDFCVVSLLLLTKLSREKALWLSHAHISTVLFP